jgi:hypothetical protein
VGGERHRFACLPAQTPEGKKGEAIDNAVHSKRHLLRHRHRSHRCGIAVAGSQRAFTMIAGHFGFAAGVKAAEQQTPLWALMLGTVWLDIVFSRAGWGSRHRFVAGHRGHEQHHPC